ncbi:redoxin domain-containing protein [Desulfobacterota bacterium AH_259_B03_O07]|nr:redoxin domain-containing protein [Desulfobacterota bacterium AH_259_B03_O07]
MNIYKLLGLTLIVAFAFCVLTVVSESKENKSKGELGSKAPEFGLEDQNDNKVDLSDFSENLVVLEWLNPDCPFVQRHYKSKTMTTLAEKYKDKNVHWLAINSTHYMNKEDNKKWIDKFNIEYPILDDSSGLVGNMYGAKTTPNMFIIDESGTLVYSGAIDDDPRGSKNGNPVNYVDQALGEIIAGKPVTISGTKPYGCSVKYSK